jgi:hypothetical protein
VPDTINFTGNTTNGSTTVGVSNIAGLAVGQYVTGAAIPVINNPTAQSPVIVTITALDQYTTANIPLFNAKSRTMSAILVG